MTEPRAVDVPDAGTEPAPFGYGPPDALYALLPAVVRQRDAAVGSPLRELLLVIGEQVAVVEDAITALGDEPFIETCSDRSVPLIGELVGWTPVADAGLAALGTPGRDVVGGAVLVPRRDVADTVRHRRRKGTLAVLEELARDVAGWPALAVEQYRLLAFAQHLAHLRLRRGAAVDVRAMDTLERLGTPSDRVARVVDVRAGGPNVPDVRVYVWRLGVYAMTGAPAAQAEHVDGPHAFTFDPLYHDVPLFVGPADGPPSPLSRRALERRDPAGAASADPAYYGEGHSLSITAHDWPRRGVTTAIPAAQVRPADLSDWRRYRVRPNTVAVDPELGRILFRPGQAPSRVTVGYHYGFPADIGGGEYRRLVPRTPAAFALWSAADGDELASRMDDWRAAAPSHAVIELTATAIYDARVNIELAAGQELTLRAGPGARPVVWLPDRRPDRADSLAATLEPGARLVLDGLTLTGRAVRLTGVPTSSGYSGEDGEPPCATTSVTLRHCTLVPGRVPPMEWDPEPPPPALELADLDGADVRVEHSVIGSVLTSAAAYTDPLRLRIADSIVDTLKPSHEAVGRPGEGLPPIVLTLVRSTVRGCVLAHAVELVENAIVLGEVVVARRRSGCVRFSWIEPGSATPRRFHCQPETAVAALGTGAPATDVARETARVRPRFSDTVYGRPAYFQLAAGVAEEIRRGSDDGAEMGAYHDLYLPVREANLTARLEEYTPASLRPALVAVT